MFGRRRKVAVLAYHAIADHVDDPVIGRWSVPPELFASHLQDLSDAGWEFVGLDAVQSALRGELDLPRNAVLLSFDDAYADLLDALPVLRAHDAPGVVFAVSDRVGGTDAWDVRNGPELDLLDVDGLEGAAAAGVEVGSHTRTHPPLGELSDDELADEIRGSADVLEELGLPRPRALAYPYGEHDEQIAREAAESGYQLAFTVVAGKVDDQSDPHRLPRIEVLSTDSPRDLRWKLRTAGWNPRLRRPLLRVLGVCT